MKKTLEVELGRITNEISLQKIKLASVYQDLKSKILDEYLMDRTIHDTGNFETIYPVMLSIIDLKIKQKHIEIILQELYKQN